MEGWGCLQPGNRKSEEHQWEHSAVLSHGAKVPAHQTSHVFSLLFAANVSFLKGQIEVQVLEICCRKGLCRKLAISLFLVTGPALLPGTLKVC